MMRIKSVMLAACLALASCGGAPEEPEAKQSPLGFVVGTHRATGSYSCAIPTGGTATFTVSTYLYLAMTGTHRWGMYLSNDVDHGSAVTINITDSYLLESADNGSVVYNVPPDTLYVHRLTPFAPIEYAHDMSSPSYSIQVTAVSTAHPYGQLVIGMYPQGASNWQKGECPDPTSIFMEIQP